jgi:hypothetical protein
MRVSCKPVPGTLRQVINYFTPQGNTFQAQQQAIDWIDRQVLSRLFGQ